MLRIDDFAPLQFLLSRRCKYIAYVIQVINAHVSFGSHDQYVPHVSPFIIPIVKN